MIENWNRPPVVSETLVEKADKEIQNCNCSFGLAKTLVEEAEVIEN